MSTAFLPPASLPLRANRPFRVATRIATSASLSGIPSVTASILLALSPSVSLQSFIHGLPGAAHALVANAEHTDAVSKTVSSSRALAIVGVSAVRIHDIASPKSSAAAQHKEDALQQQQRRQHQQRQLARLSALRDNPEAAVASRLIPAVLLGAMLGTERRALRHGLCVRTLMLVSSVSALVMVSGLAAGLAIPVAVPAVLLGVAAVLVVTAGALTAASQPRRRATATATALATAIAAAALGAASGAGLPFMASMGYLLGVCVLRLDARTLEAETRRRDLGSARDGDGSVSTGGSGTGNFGQRRRMRRGLASAGTTAAGLSTDGGVALRSLSGTGGIRSPSESSSDNQTRSIFGPSARESEKPGGRTVLRLAMETNGGPQRVVEVAGNDLDDAIRELKRRDWS